MMKISATTYLIITTAVLVLVTILVFLNAEFPIVFYLTCIGQILLAITVYNILTDNYTTEKTFKDWYEDHSTKE